MRVICILMSLEQLCKLVDSILVYASVCEVQVDQTFVLKHELSEVFKHVLLSYFLELAPL